MFVVEGIDLLEEGSLDINEVALTYATKANTEYINSYIVGGFAPRTSPPINTKNLISANISSTLTGSPSGTITYIKENTEITSLNVLGVDLKKSATKKTYPAQAPQNIIFETELSSKNDFNDSTLNNYDKEKEKTERDKLEEKASKSFGLVNYNTVPPTIISGEIFTGDDLIFPDTDGIISENITISNNLDKKNLLPIYVWTPATEEESVADETEEQVLFNPTSVTTVVTYENCSSESELVEPPKLNGDERPQSLNFDKGGPTKKRITKKIWKDQEVEVKTVTYGFAFSSDLVHTCIRGVGNVLAKQRADTDFKIEPIGTLDSYWVKVEETTTTNKYGSANTLNTTSEITFMSGYLISQVTTGQRLYRYLDESHDTEAATIKATNEFCSIPENQSSKVCTYEKYTNQDLTNFDLAVKTDYLPNVLDAMHYRGGFPILRETNYTLDNIPGTTDGIKYATRTLTTEDNLLRLSNPENQNIKKLPDLIVGKRFTEDISTTVYGQRKYTVTTTTISQEGSSRTDSIKESSSEEFTGVPSEHTPSLAGITLAGAGTTKPTDCNLDKNAPKQQTKIAKKEYLIIPQGYSVNYNESSVPNDICKTLEEAIHWAKTEWLKTNLDSGWQMNFSVPAPGLPVGTVAYGGVVSSNSINYSADDPWGGTSDITIVSPPFIEVDISTRDINDDPDPCLTASQSALYSSSISSSYPPSSTETVGVLTTPTE